MKQLTLLCIAISFFGTSCRKTCPTPTNKLTGTTWVSTDDSLQRISFSDTKVLFAKSDMTGSYTLKGDTLNIPILLNMHSKVVITKDSLTFNTFAPSASVTKWYRL